MQQSAPLQLWSTFWKFTKQVAVEPTSTPDQQWEHWATQADVVEFVWTTKESENAEARTTDLRCSCSDVQLPPPSREEEDAARKRFGLDVRLVPTVSLQTSSLHSHILSNP